MKRIAQGKKWDISIDDDYIVVGIPTFASDALEVRDLIKDLTISLFELQELQRQREEDRNRMDR